METLITVVPSFSVFILKILPGVKPEVVTDIKQVSLLADSVYFKVREAGRTCRALRSVTETRAPSGSSVAECR